MKKRINAVFCDFQPNKDWHFLNGLISASNLDWERSICVNNNQKGKLSGLKRYIKYFFFSFNKFLKRNNFDNILAWQQFYGLIFAFFCRLFRVKKRFNLYIMIFIYIPKPGIKGRLYYKFIHYILSSVYIDKIFLFSSSEIKKYAEEFNISAEKFVFLPFGDDASKSFIKCDLDDGFIFSSGYSNRDYEFLENCLLNTHYTVRIYGKVNKINANIIMSDEFVENRLTGILQKTKVVVVPLKENRESGQFTIIHAMEAGIPVIATDTDCMKDYIIDGVNGFVLPNEKDAWLEKINLLYNDEKLYREMSNNCKRIFQEKHTEMALGKNIGTVIFEYIGDKK